MIDNLFIVAEVISAISVIAGVFIAIWKWRKKQKAHDERIDNANRCLLRDKIVNIYYRHKDEKRFRQYERENLDLLYEGYKELGGNSFVDTIYSEMKGWEVIS